MNLSRTFAGAGLILLPFIFELSGDDQLRAPKAKMFFILAAFYVAGLLWQRGLRPLAAGLAVAFISAYFSKTIFPYDDMAVFLAAGLSCLWVDLSPLLITDTPEKYDFERFFKLAEGVGLVAAAYAFVQIVGHDPILNYYSWADHGRPVIFFGQHTLYGPWAVAVFAIALFRRHWIRAAVLLVPILFINSSFTFLSLAVVLGLFLVQRIPFRFVALATFLGFLGLTLVHQARPDLLEEPLNDKGRFVLWDQTLELGNAALGDRLWPGLLPRDLPRIPGRGPAPPERNQGSGALAPHDRIHAKGRAPQAGVGLLPQSAQFLPPRVFHDGGGRALCGPLDLATIFRRFLAEARATGSVDFGGDLLLGPSELPRQFPFRADPAGPLSTLGLRGNDNDAAH